MKKLFYSMMVMSLIVLFTYTGEAQANIGNIAGVTYLKGKHPEGGTAAKRDSLIAIFNANVTNKNEYILSHREYRHYYTPSSTDYMIIEEYKDLASMEKANQRNDELIEAAWPDKAKRDVFMDAMNAYWENWHGDAIYTINTKLSKN
ncbi:MAG TPA: hypothetical protein VJ508_06105 [Saprospiraceae bacterium]|nr:hypothetical protein [Saprospiraceae bacterium]